MNRNTGSETGCILAGVWEITLEQAGAGQISIGWDGRVKGARDLKERNSGGDGVCPDGFFFGPPPVGDFGITCAVFEPGIVRIDPRAEQVCISYRHTWRQADRRAEMSWQNHVVIEGSRQSTDQGRLQGARVVNTLFGFGKSFIMEKRVQSMIRTSDQPWTPALS